MNDSKDVSLSEALQFIRHEYLTSLGSNEKDLSPTQICDSMNDVYKSQLKAMHHLGKGIQSFLTSNYDFLRGDVKKIADDIKLHFLQISFLNRQHEQSQKKVAFFESELYTLMSNQSRLVTAVERNLELNNEIGPMI